MAILATIGRLILARVLAGPEVKAAVLKALREQAARSDTKIDDQAVEIIAEAWDAVVPAVVARR